MNKKPAVMPNAKDKTEVGPTMQKILDIEKKIKNSNTGKFGSQSLLVNGPRAKSSSQKLSSMFLGTRLNESISSSSEETGPKPSRSQTASNSDFSSASLKQKNVMRELLFTEEAYVNRLQVIDRNFRKYFLTKADNNEKNYPSSKAIEEMFSNLCSIIAFHTSFFLPDLKTRIEAWDSNPQIGDIFLKYGPHFKLYTIYINNYENACTNITLSCKRYSKFANDMEMIEKGPECKNLKLMHHMLDPIQRIPRYKLLLTEYLKKVEPDSDEEKDVKSALELISASAQKANDRIRETQNAMKMLEIQQMIIDSKEIVTVGRSFVREGDLMRKSSRGTKYVACHLFLFNDLLMCCVKNNPNKYRKKFAIDFPLLALKEDTDEKQANAFSIGGLNGPYTLSTTSAEDKDLWISTIKKKLDEFDSKTISFLIKNKGTTTVGHTASNDQLHYVLLSKVMIFDVLQNKWVTKIIALTTERKLIISHQESQMSVQDTSYFLEDAELSTKRVEEFNCDSIVLKFLSANIELSFLSKIDDLFYPRWYNLIEQCLKKRENLASGGY